MNFFNKIWNFLKEPKIWFLFIFYVFFLICIGGTITLIVLVESQTVWHFLIYVLSAVLLSYFVYTIIYFTPKIKNSIIENMKKHKFTNALLENYGYRTIIFSIFSLIINIAYVIFIGVLAAKTHSAWYISITAYYLILILMKGNIFYSKKKYNTTRKQARAYRYCGIMFILLTLAFSGIIVLIYTSNMYFEYAGLLIYVIAVFTFYKLSLSIVNIFKARQQEDLYIQSIRNINLVSALVSLVVMQVAMFQAFSPANNTSFANALTGGAVSAIILALGIFMIIKSNKLLKNIEKTSKSDTKNDKIIEITKNANE